MIPFSVNENNEIAQAVIMNKKTLISRLIFRSVSDESSGLLGLSKSFIFTIAEGKANDILLENYKLDIIKELDNKWYARVNSAYNNDNILNSKHVTSYKKIATAIPFILLL